MAGGRDGRLARINTLFVRTCTHEIEQGALTIRGERGGSACQSITAVSNASPSSKCWMGLTENGKCLRPVRHQRQGFSAFAVSYNFLLHLPLRCERAIVVEGVVGGCWNIPVPVNMGGLRLEPGIFRFHILRYQDSEVNSSIRRLGPSGNCGHMRPPPAERG